MHDTPPATTPADNVDVLIIGGGIVGAGVARDAAMRGLNTLLVDRHDFAFGTSSRSSRLLHGGLRYLAQGRVGLVREASREKMILARIAPHLAQPLAFVFPTYHETDWPKWKLRVGVKLYDLLCGKSNLGYSGGLSAQEVITHLPSIRSAHLTGAVRYYDGLTSDARLVLDTLRSAERHGARLMNYTALSAAERADDRWECRLQGMSAGRLDESLSVRASVVVNATGAWSPQLKHARVRLRQTKGVHLVVERSRMPITDALVMTESKRILFCIPWGERVILGTTDTDYTGPADNPDCTPDDQAYVLGVVNGMFPSLALHPSDVISAWSGVRPLIANANGAPSDISRAHLIDEHDGWIDVAGGKLTTYRLMAEQTIDRAMRLLNRPSTYSTTAAEPILPADQTQFSGILPPPVTPGAVEHYCAHEHARHLDDVMIRRTSWRYYHRDHLDIARQVVEWMESALGWSPDRTAGELRRYEKMTESAAPAWTPWAGETSLPATESTVPPSIVASPALPRTSSPESSSMSSPVSATTQIELGDEALQQTAAIFCQHFGDRPAMVVADENTWRAAGRAVHDQLSAAGRTAPPLIFPASPVLYAEMSAVDAVSAALADKAVIPVAVGAGTINDLVKLAAHRRGKGYLVVATAASMDGYSAFGASITERGSKQTFDCPAPRAVVADVGVIAAAPPGLASIGYADLAAKVTAGADWILADALGIEPIHPDAWACVQTPLRAWLGSPEAVGRGEREAIRHLMQGLLASGIGMQITRDSRPASGAEHQFSHLWDMQNHRHNDQPVSHGAKVAIGTLASAVLYELILQLPLETLDIDACLTRRPTREQADQQVAALHTIPALREKARLESQAKWVNDAALRQRLLLLKQQWPDLRERLRAQLLPPAELQRMLTAAGAPAHPTEIGVPFPHLRESYVQAHSIRRRYTVLDLASDLNQLDSLVEQLFAPGGMWGK